MWFGNFTNFLDFIFGGFLQFGSAVHCCTVTDCYLLDLTHYQLMTHEKRQWRWLIEQHLSSNNAQSSALKPYFVFLIITYLLKYISATTYIKGSFNNYVDMILPFFDHLPTCTWTFITLNVDQNWHILTTYPPHLVHVVIECPQSIEKNLEIHLSTLIEPKT